jgi:hypothetical protein
MARVGDKQRRMRQDASLKLGPLAGVVLLGCLVASIGETFAVAGALGCPIGEFGVYLVAVVLVGATFTIAAGIWWPWFSLAFRGTRFRAGIPIGAAAIAVSCVTLLAGSVHLAAQRQRLAAETAKSDAEVATLTGLSGTAAGRNAASIPDLLLARSTLNLN